MKAVTYICTFLVFSVLASPLNAQNDYGGQTGHAPFHHDHSGNCGGPSGGVCYGYAMGTMANMCSASTMIPANTCNAQLDQWANWGVDENYFEKHDEPTLNTSGPIIIRFSGHVAYCSSGALNTPSFIQINHIRAAGESQVTDTAYWQGSCYNWTNPGYGNYNSIGYYTKKDINVTARNLFYDGSNTTTSVGSVTVGSSSGTSPHTWGLSWSSSGSVSATSPQDYPSGYRQYFANNWTQGGNSVGSTIEKSFVVQSGLEVFQAEFYQAAPITFALDGAGGIGYIYVDGQPRYSTYVKYARIHPGTAESVSATATNSSDNNIDYNFVKWTNSVSNDTVWTSNLSFSASAIVTYTAHFVAKPEPPTNLHQTAPIGQNVSLAWSCNPNTAVQTTQIYRHQAGQQQSLVATRGNRDSVWTDPDVLVADPKDGPVFYYDICHLYGGIESDYVEVGQYGEELGAHVGMKLADGEGANTLPTEFSVSNHPNPFNPSTTISYSLPENSSVKLEIYDVTGRSIRSLVDDNESGGYHNVVWNGRDATGREVSSGMYFYRFMASPVSGHKPFMQSGKLVLMK